MKKNDFMQRLSDELQKRNVADAADILQEYEAHFAMKMADGYIEEEIAARLGDPTALAAQFDDAEETPEKKGRQQAAGGGRAVLCGRVCGAVFHPAGRVGTGAGGSLCAPTDDSGKTRWPRPPARRGCPRCPSARSFPRKQDGGCVPWRWWRWHCLRCASCWRTSCAPCRREACSFGTRGAGLRNDQRRKNLQRNLLRAIFLFLEQQLICSQ